MRKSTPSPGPSLRRFTLEDGSQVTVHPDGSSSHRMNLLQLLAAEHAEQHPGHEVLVCSENPDGTPDLENSVRGSDALKATHTWRRIARASHAPQQRQPQLPPQRPRATGRTRRETRRSSSPRGSPDSDDDSSSEPPGATVGRHLTVARVAARYSFACLPLEARS